jgi:hypothetical protein
MSARLESLARDKRALLDRSALYRLRLRRDAFALRGSLNWRRAAVAATIAPGVGRIFFGLAVSMVGLGRSARAVMLLGRVVLIARLARIAIDYARWAARPQTPDRAIPLP